MSRHSLILFTTILCARPMSQLLSECLTRLLSCGMDTLSTTTLSYNINSFAEVQKYCIYYSSRSVRWITLLQKDIMLDKQDFLLMKTCWL